MGGRGATKLEIPTAISVRERPSRAIVDRPELRPSHAVVRMLQASLTPGIRGALGGRRVGKTCDSLTDRTHMSYENRGFEDGVIAGVET
jgi:hypothetical protein